MSEIPDHHLYKNTDESLSENHPNEKFVTDKPLPTPAENELLTCIIEECAEVIKRCTKAQRFGLQQMQPGQEKTNVERIAHEVGELTYVFNYITSSGYAYMLPGGSRVDGWQEKERKLPYYIQHADK